MAAPRRRLTRKSSALAPSGSQVEEPRSPAAKEIAARVLEYQRRIEQARREHQETWAIEYPDEAEQDLGELEMQVKNPNIVQTQLSELVQLVLDIVQACTKEKELLEDEFESVQANITISEIRIQSDK